LSRPGPPRRSGPDPHDPELLTHAAPASPAGYRADDPDDYGEYGDDHGSDDGEYGEYGEYGDGYEDDYPDDGYDDEAAGRWRKGRKIALVAALLLVLAPVLAFFAGWLFLSVPSPTALAAERKQVTTIMASDGTTELGRYVPANGNRIDVTLDQVPRHVQNAVLAAEDRSFRSNPGFDVMGIGRAVYNQATGGSGGGSTITQQYVKVATGEDEYSLWRKFREMIIAAKLTKQNSKDQILENYLNTIYFGRGAYGIQAASHAYFGKTVQQLTPAQGAVLAGAIQAPSLWDPAKNLEQSQLRWNYVLDGMVAEGWLSKADRAAAQYPVTVPPQQEGGLPTDDRAHVIKRVLDELEAHGITREQMARQGGRIVTTIDPKAQDLARKAVLAQLGPQPKNLHSALVAVDPHTGAVVAYYGGQDGNGFDLAGGPAWQPGSSFKPFTMLAALKQNIGINSVYSGSSPVVVDGVKFANSESRSYNALTLHDAMTQSVNTTFVQLAKDVGPQAVRDAAIEAGIPDQIDGKQAMVEADGGQPAVGITLGQYPVHTLDMADAYATFAADGMRHAPFFVREYDDSQGNVGYAHPDKPTPAFDPADLQHNTQLARNVTATMMDVARNSQIPLKDGRQVAAKTGTSQLGDTGHNSAAWTVGYTPSISTAVWMGDPANSAIKDKNGNDIFGRGVPGAIWQQFMDSYLAGTPKETFPPYKLIVGKDAGPAAAQLAPPTSQRRPIPVQDQRPEPTDTVEPTPVPTRVRVTPTEQPPQGCFVLGCDNSTTSPRQPGFGGGGPGDGTGQGGP
jgi:membrane peptidoglycan carboxypeptidase